MLKTYYFVCLLVLSIIITDFVRCEPSDYVFSVKADGWLKLHTTPAVWEEAFLRCHNDSTVLASPLNQELADALRTQMAQLGVNGRIFLGTHDLYAKGLFASVEGVPLHDLEMKWGSHGNVADTGDCLTMSVDGSSYYASCNDSLPYICYRHHESSMIDKCGTFDNEYHYNRQTSKCYKVHVEEQTWTRAYEICASEGGNLVILKDDEEASIVKEMFPVDQGLQFHIGLRAWSDARIWTSIHGDKIEDVFNHWNTSQPDNWYGNQDRATYLRNGYLDDVQPWTIAMFVCEKNPK